MSTLSLTLPCLYATRTLITSPDGQIWRFAQSHCDMQKTGIGGARSKTSLSLKQTTTPAANATSWVQFPSPCGVVV